MRKLLLFLALLFPTIALAEPPDPRLAVIEHVFGLPQGQNFGGGGLGAVTLTGAPTTGQVPTATSSTTATWQTPSGGVGTSTAFAVPYYNTTTTVTGVAAPTSPNGVPFTFCSIPAGGIATIPAWCWPGVALNAQTGASYTIASSDRGSVVTDSNVGATAITLPQAGSTNFANNFNFGLFNINTGLVTITPTTSTINGAATQIVPNHWASYIYSDPSNNYRAGTFADISAYPNCVTGALNFTAATGAFSCNANPSTLDTVGNPVASKTFTFPSANTLAFQAGTATSTNNVFSFVDGAGNTGTGDLVIVNGVVTSSLANLLDVYGNSVTGTPLLARFAGNNNTSRTTIDGFSNEQVRLEIVQGGASLGQLTVGSSSTADAVIVSPIAGATGKCFRSNNPGSTTTINWSVDCATGLNTSDGGFIQTQSLHAITMPVTIGSGTSIGSTILCAAADCPAGTYVIPTYLDITTACGTSGTYIVNLIYTDDQGAKTIVVNINGTGSVPATGTLTTTSTANYGENSQVIRLTSGNINYSTTATACGTGGPMVGKLYMVANRVM